jgi:peptidoglycan/LPS O-acetylase OafA/YrhL
MRKEQTMLIDIIITMSIFFVLLFCVVYKAKIYPVLNPNFFNIEVTNALRGIWSIIVIMVHIPKQYGNIIQDMAGSFAYIGVTFFFLASGFGLSQSVVHRQGISKKFWLKRLPKLLIPQLLVNIIAALLNMAVFGENITLPSLLWIARWLRWLLLCYLIFWIAHTLCKSSRSANILIFISLIIFSVSQYCLKRRGIITENIWATEIFGFLWGIGLSSLFSHVQKQAGHSWMLKTTVLFVSALLLGVSYLLLKTVVFWGDYLLKIMLGFAIIACILFLNLKVSVGNKALGFLGKISYELYLTHSIIISIAKRGMVDISSGAFILLVLASSIMMSVVVHFVSSMIMRGVSSVISTKA